MIVERPPMGWNSWNTFGENINEEMIMQTADYMADNGFIEAGYNYLVIDDCWALRDRNDEGKFVPDPKKFPHGMKYISDYVHSKGLKFGMYSCAGSQTCAGYPGSYEHEWVDAKTFAEWGVDFLKYDYCFHSAYVPGEVLYKRMGLALKECGRDILYSACSWGADETRHWIKSTGANMWRTTPDIADSWKSLQYLALLAPKSIRYSAKNCFGDMDMLTVGMRGKGNVGLTGMTDDEYRLHFAMWALLGSPLMIGCDIREMDEETRKILFNKELIAINQDIACCQPFPINFSIDDEEPCDIPIYARMLDNGDYAIGIFNMSEATLDTFKTFINFDVLGIPESTGKYLEMTELYTGEKITIKDGVYKEPIPPHCCRIFRAKVVNR